MHGPTRYLSHFTKPVSWMSPILLKPHRVQPMMREPRNQVFTGGELIRFHRMDEDGDARMLTNTNASQFTQQLMLFVRNTSFLFYLPLI